MVSARREKRENLVLGLKGQWDMYSSAVLIFICGNYIFRINTLQKAIFRAKQIGDSVKIVLRCDNILDIEKTAAFEFADYLRIRTVDNDDSYAMDEVGARLGCVYNNWVTLVSSLELS